VLASVFQDISYFGLVPGGEEKWMRAIMFIS